jgi:hypothetical protein
MKERETMNTQSLVSLRALRDLSLLWGAALLAASAWAAGLTEEGFILEAPVWHTEVAGAPSPDWPVDGWYRITPTAKSIIVSSVKPSVAEPGEPEGTVYVRVPGTRLVEGRRPKFRFAGDLLRPKVGQPYELMLDRIRFSFQVESGRDGTQLRVGYGGQTYSYMLGLPAAATRIHAIADLDGDTMPDFLVEVGDDTYLLLSTQARPGHNPPSAQLWAIAGR